MPVASSALHPPHLTFEGKCGSGWGHWFAARAVHNRNHFDIIMAAKVSPRVWQTSKAKRTMK